ncbi:MAG: peptidyl-prolyl cis-trans isomerase [Candidatus Cloacimonas sp.]|jgi:TolA-binding protein|nr:peptidyl-prolyl cis-trans isomerase [Candidatus Cloacimonas sp.]
MSSYLRFSLGLIFLFVCLSLSAADTAPIAVSSDNLINDTDILAEFDGGQITRKDIQTKITKLPPNYQSRYQTVDGQIEVLNITATEEVFYQKAKQMGLDKDPSVMERIQAVEKRFYIQEYYQRNVSDLVILTDADLLNYYNQNLSSFYLNPTISIDYIQVSDEAEGKKALAELKRGVPFAEVSDKYNQNVYAKGLLGSIKNIRLNGNIPGVGNDAELEALIAKSKVDENIYIGPLQTATGWHIFRTVEWAEGHQKEFLEVKPEIEQRLRPTKERDALNAIIDKIKLKYAVVVDSSMINLIDLKNRGLNNGILDTQIVKSSKASLSLTVGQILASYDKISPQEQVFIMKGGGVNQLIDSELIQNLLYEEAKANGYEKYFVDNEDYAAMKRSYILRRAFEILVVDTIEVSPTEIQNRYERDLEQYATPAYRTIEVLFFDKKKDADKAWRKFNSAHKKKNEKKMQDVIAKYSLKPESAILDNQYQNGVITGMGADADFSKMIWDNPVGYLSPVFTSARGDIVFFRTLKEVAKTYKPQLEAEPRIYGLIKKEKEKTRQDQVSENLFVEFNMRKYPERVRLTLTADELFTQADNAARQRNFKDAIVFYDQIISTYKNGNDDYKASFMKAFLVAEELKNTDMALQLFQDFLMQFPEGDLNESARFMIDSLQGNIPEELEQIDN